MKTTSLIQLEWRLLCRDRVFWLALTISLLLLGYGFHNGTTWAGQQLSLVRQSQKDSQDLLNNLKTNAAQARKDKAPAPVGLEERQGDARYALGIACQYQAQDCRMPTALASLAVGQSDLLALCLPAALWSAEGGDGDSTHQDLENPLRLLLGRFDAAFVILLLLPVSVLVISFDLLSREKELGTLPLLRSQPVGLRCILAIRFNLRAILFTGFVLVTVLACLCLGGFNLNEQDNQLTLLLWLITTAAYLSFWFACAFWLNSRGNSSAQQGLQLAGIWLALTVIAPGCLNLALKQLYPAPSRLDYIDQVRAAGRSTEQQKSKLLGKYLSDHPDLAGGDKTEHADDYIETRIALNDESERLLSPLKQAFRDQSQKQQAFVDSAFFLSPALAYQHISQQLAGQDLARHQRFLDAVSLHRAALKSFYFPRLTADNGSFADYGDIPTFQPHEPPSSHHLALSLQALLAILLPGVALVWAGGRNLRQYDLTNYRE